MHSCPQGPLPVTQSGTGRDVEGLRRWLPRRLHGLGVPVRRPPSVWSGRTRTTGGASSQEFHWDSRIHLSNLLGIQPDAERARIGDGWRSIGSKMPFRGGRVGLGHRRLQGAEPPADTAHETTSGSLWDGPSLFASQLSGFHPRARQDPAFAQHAHIARKDQLSVHGRGSARGWSRGVSRSPLGVPTDAGPQAS